MTLADAIRQAITDSGVTSYALAKRAGISPQMVSRWLRGDRENMTLATADKIATALGIRIESAPKKLSRKSPSTD